MENLFTCLHGTNTTTVKVLKSEHKSDFKGEKNQNSRIVLNQTFH